MGSYKSLTPLWRLVLKKTPNAARKVIIPRKKTTRGEKNSEIYDQIKNLKSNKSNIGNFKPGNLPHHTFV